MTQLFSTIIETIGFEWLANLPRPVAVGIIVGVTAGSYQGIVELTAWLREKRTKTQ